jgi:ATP-dependent Clp protease ATP-binding subunit ClpA
VFERFTDAARETVIRARRESQRLHHTHTGTEHLLLALLDSDAGLAYAVLHDAGLDADDVRAEIQRLVGRPATVLSDEDAAALRTVGIDLDAVLAKIEETFGPGALDPPDPPKRRGIFGLRDGGRFTPRARKVLELSLREALHLRHRYIGTEHLLLGLIREGDGLAARILVDAGVPLDGLRRVLLAALREAA